MEKDLISVIVPIYNVEKYLGKCVNSIINQIYKNIEIILVDDGSTDNSGKIADEYAKKDSRIKVIHKENGGLSSARNVGIKNATGEFIGFVDSDDFIKDDFYEFLIKLQKENDADIVQCNYIRVYEDKINTFCFLPKKEEYKMVTDKFGAFYMYLSDDDVTSTIMVVVWNKLYKKNIFNDINFPIEKTNEDQFTMYKIFDKCKKIVISNSVKYGYLQRNNSIMTKKLTEKRFDVFEAFDNFLQYLHENNYEEYEGFLLRRYLKVVIEIAEILNTADDNDKENLKNKLVEIWNSKYEYTLNFIENLDIHTFQLNRILKLKDEFERIIKNV